MNNVITLYDTLSYKLTLKQKINLETRNLISKDKIQDLEDSNEKYTKLLISMFTISYYNINNENINKWFQFFENNNQWLKNTLKRIDSSLTDTKILSNFIQKYKKCIKSDIIEIKKIMQTSNRQINYINFKSLATAFNTEIFEAPKNHMLRIWKLKIAKLIAQNYSEFETDFTKTKNKFQAQFFKKIHKLISNTALNEMTSDKYYVFFNSPTNKQDRIKLMNYIKKNNFEFIDFDDPDFNIEDYENQSSSFDESIDNQSILSHSGSDQASSSYLKDTKSSDKEIIEDVTHTNKKRKINLESSVNLSLLPQNKTVNASTQTDAEIKIDVAVQVKSKKGLECSGDNKKDSTKENSYQYLNFTKLHNNSKYSDAVLLTSDKKLQAHKCILAGYSDVFFKMFENNIKNIDMSQISSEVAEAMLQFMYKNHIDNLDKISKELLSLSCQYKVKGLINICEKNLLKNINYELVSDILIIANKYKLKSFKDELLKYIVLNRKKVVATKSFKNMQNAFPELVAELFCYLTDFS